MRLFLIFIGILGMVMGVKFVYDARSIAKKYFRLEDNNKASFTLKLIGFAILIVGALLIYLEF